MAWLASHGFTLDRSRGRTGESAFRHSVIGQTVQRFYTTASIVAQKGGFAVVLDNKLLCTPGRAPLIVPSRSLAEGIADEWQAQGSTISPVTIPLTQLANTAIDCMQTLRQEGLDTLMALAATDLVCYRATAPQALVEYQQTKWQPLLNWMAQRYKAPFRITTGVIPVKQSKVVLATVHDVLSAMDSFHLAALYRAATLCSSLVIALALINGRISADVAFVATQLDLLFQNEHWGTVSETEAHHKNLSLELKNISIFIHLLES